MLLNWTPAWDWEEGMVAVLDGKATRLVAGDLERGRPVPSSRADLSDPDAIKGVRSPIRSLRRVEGSTTHPHDSFHAG